MRYALRKQQKIKEVLGDDTLSDLTNSLDKHFKENTSIKTMEGQPHPTIEVKSLNYVNKTLVFYHTKTLYDVYHLSYYKTK